MSATPLQLQAQSMQKPVTSVVKTETMNNPAKLRNGKSIPIIKSNDKIQTSSYSPLFRISMLLLVILIIVIGVFAIYSVLRFSGDNDEVERISLLGLSHDHKY